MADKQINIVIGADIDKLRKGFDDAVKVIGASGKQISSQMDATVKAIEKDFERIANSPNTKRTVAQLQNLALKVQELGPEFQDMANKIIQAAGKIKDKVGDAGAQITYFASDTRRIDAVISGAQGIAGAFSIAEGAAALFGNKNKDLEKAMLKVQGALALLNGLQAVANTLQQESAFMTGLAAAKQGVLAVATYASASATNALKVALISTGIGAFVVLLGTLASAYMDTTEASDEFAKKQKEIKDQAIKDGVDYINGLDKNTQDEFDLIEKLGKINNKSQVEILKEQKKFAYEQQKINSQKIADQELSVEESRAASALSIEWSKKYNALDIELQIATNDEKKKNYEKQLKDEKDFIKQKQELDKALNNLKPGLVGGELNMPTPSVESQGGMLAIAKKAKEDTLKFTESISSDIITAEKDFTDKKYTIDQTQIANLRATLKANQALTDERIKQREREKRINDEYLANNEKFVAQFNATFAGIQSDAYANLGIAIADALMNGSNLLQSAFSIILNSIGTFADAYGKALIAAGIASEAFQKLLISNPLLAVGAGIALVAAGSIVRSVAQKGPTAFADGGIVSGPTLGLMGEYPGASTNPEVIAPLSKLQSMLAPSNGGFPAYMETRFDGRDLYLAVKKYERDSKRG